MIKYHGTPFSPISLFIEKMTGLNILVPFSRKDSMSTAVKISNKLILDNGAFSTWKQALKGNIANLNWDKHWIKYYEWVNKNYANIDYYFIPDVIDGTEQENDRLIEFYLNNVCDKDKKAIPVWHINESFERLEFLEKHFDYIAFGSAGEFKTLGTWQWSNRMREIMDFCCDENGKPRFKIHMLRCLNKDIFTQYPFYSGDSATVARNHSDYGEKGVDILLDRIMPFFSPSEYKFKSYQGSLF